MYCCFVACSFIRNLRLVYNDMVTFYISMMELYHDKISRKNAIILIEIYKPLSFLVGTYRNLHSDNSWHHNLVPRSEPWTKVPMIWLIFWPMNVSSVGRSELPAWMTTGSCPGSAPAANQMYTPRCYMLSFYLFVPLVRTHWIWQSYSYSINLGSWKLNLQKIKMSFSTKIILIDPVLPSGHHAWPSQLPLSDALWC